MAGFRRAIPPWVRMAQGFWLDPKMRKVSIEARYLYLVGLQYAGSADSDGFIPDDMLPILAADIPGGHGQPMAELVKVDAWARCNGGVTGVTVGEDRWDFWQQTAEERSDKKAKERDRSKQRRAEEKRKAAERDAELAALRAQVEGTA